MPFSVRFWRFRSEIDFSRKAAYRQDALRLAGALAVNGAMPVAALRRDSAVPRAAKILQRNVYGWFQRLARGTYGLTAEGRQALIGFADALAAVAESPAAAAPGQ